MYLVDPKQGNNNAKLEKLRLKSVREKANDRVFFFFGGRIRKHVNYLPGLCTKVKKKKKWYIHGLLDELNNPAQFQRRRKSSLKTF